MNTDPTREEMIKYLSGLHKDWGDYNFLLEEAIYWFAYDYHGGQWTNLYSVLSTSKFHPSPLQRNIPYDSLSKDMYNELVKHFIK